ncbi:MAG: protein-L-isoaspartate(D-aspartate) O-methyltransferase [Armatimonadota bacterium]
MATDDSWEEYAGQMVRDLRAKGIMQPEVLAAMRAVPRHRFVPGFELAAAYGDHPLPIGHGQTISQPYIVAHMAELLRLDPEDVLLEVGTGSGYAAAVFSLLARRVVSIERLPALAQEARRTLDALGYANVQVVVGDGTLGYPQDAPYTAIAVAASAPALPSPLIEQLAPGGCLLIPLGVSHHQELVRVTRGAGELQREVITPVAFVPLIGEHAHHP